DYILRLPDSTFPGSEEYIFKHNREREAIQKRTRPTAAKRYHQGIADWMDHQKALRTGEEFIAMLAEHREKAGDALRGGLAYLEADGLHPQPYSPAHVAEGYTEGPHTLRH